MSEQERQQLEIAKTYVKQLIHHLAYLIDPDTDFEKVYQQLKTQKFRYTNKQSVDVMYVSRIEHMELTSNDTKMMFRYLKNVYNLLSTCSFTYLSILNAGIQVEGTEAGKGVFRVSVKQAGQNLELIVSTKVTKQE